mmetsp:Transcript_33937/g.81403  ORF Transcript_33937/g.81403 Transcript_33937/m.81403 type:complete len:645 (-) Transcript_33937:139-2073(-)
MRSLALLAGLSHLRVSSVQVEHRGALKHRLEPLEALSAEEELLDPDVQGSIAAALETIAEDQKLDDKAVFMQDGMSIKKEVISQVKRHSAWQLVAEDLVQKRFGNSTAARGLRTLLSEAGAAEVSMTDWQHLALGIASLTPRDVLAKEGGPSHAFPARHVAMSKGPREANVESDMEDRWNEWTVICVAGLLGIMVTSIITANKRSQPGKISRLLELETRWKLTGSSTAGSLSLLRQAAEAQSAEPAKYTEDLSVWDTTVAVFSCLVGTGLLAMPYAFSLAGLIGAPLVLLFVICSAYTAHLMVWAMQAEAARQCIPSGSRVRAATLDWSALAHAAFGPKARKAVEMFLIVELWGYLLSTIVCASMNVSQLGLATAPAVALSVSGAALLTFVPAKVLTKVNVMSNLVYIASALMFLATGLMLPKKAPTSEIQMVKPHGLLAAAGILIFSPAGHSFYPRLIQQMEEPAKFPRCLKLAYAAACAVYLLIAVPGYVLFGNATQPSAVRNIGLDRDLVALPDLGWMNTAAAFGLVVKLIPNQALVLSPLTAVIKGALRSRFTEFDAVSGFVTPVVLLASALLAVHFASQMAYLLNLLGSFFCMNIAFVLPVICYWRLTSESPSPARQMLFALLVAMGLSGAVLGVVSCF